MAVSTNEFLDIQAMIERGFTLKCMRDTIRIYSQTHFTDSTQSSSIIWPVWLNCWVFVHKLRGCGFESLKLQILWLFQPMSSLTFRQLRVWIDSDMHMWHDKNIQSNVPNRWVLATQLNHLASLAKWLSACLWSKWLWVRVLLQSLKNDSLCIKSYFMVKNN